MIQENFLPRLLFGKTKSLSSTVGYLSTIPVKKIVLGILNPVSSENEKYLCSHLSRADFIRAVMGEGVFSYSYFLLALIK